MASSPLLLLLALSFVSAPVSALVLNAKSGSGASKHVTLGLAGAPASAPMAAAPSPAEALHAAASAAGVPLREHAYYMSSMLDKLDYV